MGVQTHYGHLSIKNRPSLDFAIIELNDYSWLNYLMENKGFADNQNSIETPNDAVMAEKPLVSKTNVKLKERVDINVLKSKLKESESKEFKKNLYILSSLILILGFIGIYLSL